MKAYVEFHDGTKELIGGVGRTKLYDGRVIFEVTADNVVRVHNVGLPNPINLNAVTYKSQPVYIKCVLAQDDTLVPELIGLNGTRAWAEVAPFIKGAYILIDKDDPKVPAPGDALSTQYHLLDGSDCFEIRFVDPANPTATANIEAKALEERRKKCLDLLNVDIQLLKEYPILQDLSGLYTANADSINPQSMNRNFGWWLWPACYHARWGDWPALPYLQSQYGFMSTWANSDGLTNEHYDHPLFWMLSYLLRGDAVALEIGLTLLRKKISYGLYDINDTNHPYYGFWKQEKGNRLGFYQLAPASAKEWDTSLVVASILTEEPIFQRALDVRVEALLKRPNDKVWPRAAGGRMAGRYLQNLLIFYKADINGRGNEFISKAESFINYFFAALKPYEKWIPNDYDRDWTDTWEGMTFYNFAQKWMQMGICNQHIPRMAEMLEWTGRAAWTWRDEGRLIPQVAYRVRVDGSAPGTNWNEIPYHMAFWTQVWDFMSQDPAYVDAANAISDFMKPARETLYGYIGRTWNEIVVQSLPPLKPGTLRVDQPGFGPSAEKQWPMILESVVRY